MPRPWGVVFRATGYYEEGTTNTYKTFASINRSGSYYPQIEINYTPKLTITSPSAEILVGETLTLTATITPADASATLTFTSSDNFIATVSDTGVVTGVSAGTVIITATDADGNSDSCTVTVNERSLEIIASRYYSAYNGNIQVGTVSEQPAGTTYTWTTSKSSVATIAPSGMLQFHNIGAVDVTVTASTGDTATKTFYGIYPDGVYKIQNANSYKYATLESDRIVEDMNISQYRDQSEALKQLWRVHYVGDGEYVIRSMQNPSLVMAMDTAGSIQRNVKAENMGTSDDDLPDRAKWYFRGTTYTMFTEVTVNAITYQLAVAVGDTSDYSNIYAITSEGSGVTSWRLVAMDTVDEGVLIYNGNTNITHKTLYMSLGNVKQLTAIYYTTGENFSQEFEWESNTPAIATVDEDTGLIHAVGNGLATITVTSKVDSRYSAYCYVYVSDDLDFDGVSSDNETNSSSNIFSGTLRKVSDDPNKVENYSAEYTFDYRAFLDSPDQFNADLCQLSSIASTIIYRNWHFVENGTDIGGIRAWLNYHGMSKCTLIDIGKDTEDYNNSQIVLGYRPVSTITDSTIVVAVVIRGTTGLEEWSSNMDVGDTREGTSGDWTDLNHHKGFDITANRILREIDNYIRPQIKNTTWADTEITYWVTGHSRGGALANLVAADLIEKGERVFAYTFASPATTVCAECKNANRGQCMGYTSCKSRDAKYDSIFNIVNEDDFISYFPLKQWYFTRYGRTTSNLSIHSGYKNEWESECNTEYLLMENPKAPFDVFYEVVPERNSCYDHYDNLLTGYTTIYVSSTDPVIHPGYTSGYYMRIPISFDTDSETETMLEYQKPMFLMMYFAALGANEVGALDFVLTEFASYLDDSKWTLLAQVVGLSISDLKDAIDEGLNIKFDKTRIDHPHRPVSYYYLTQMIIEEYDNDGTIVFG